MADIVNLRRHRKHKAREAADLMAAANRVAFGRSKAERQVAQAERERDRTALDGHRLERDPSDQSS